MSIIKKLAGQTAVYGLSSIVGRLLNYLLVPLYTGSLSTGEYGVSSWFYAFASFAGVIFTYGMETAFFRYASAREDKERVFSTALTSLLFSSAGMAALLILFSSPLAHWTKNEGRELYFFYFAIILAADAVTAIPFAWLRQKDQPRRFASLKILSILTNIVLNLMFFWLFPALLKHGMSDVALFYNPEYGISYMFIANLISSLVVLPFFSKEFGLLRFGFDKVLWREMIVYSFPLIFMGFAGMINETLDRILLKELIPDQAYAEQQTGIYAANYKLSILITLFIQAFRFAAEPFFFARAKEQDAKQVYARVMQYFVVVCCSIFLLVTLYLDVFKYFIRKPAYWEGLQVVPILLMANLFLGVYYNLAIWYKLTDKTKLGAWVSVGGAVITLVLNILWIPHYGYLGSAWATLICYFSMAAASYWLGTKYYPVPYPLRRLITYVALALALYFVSDIIKTQLPDWPAWARLLANTPLFGAYFGILYLMEGKTLKTGLGGVAPAVVVETPV